VKDIVQRETTINLDSREEAFLIFGMRDQFLREIRTALGLQVTGRGDHIILKGTDEQITQGERVFAIIRQTLRQHGTLQAEDVRSALETVVGGIEGRVAPIQTEKAEGGPGPSKWVRARTEGQGRYVQAMRENDIVLCVGPAGTGKTWLAVGMAVSLLRQGMVKKIVLVRPAVEAGEKLGFLPGDIAAKVNPYLRPLFDALNDMMDPEQVKKYSENDIIEIAPLAYMRGRTLNQAAIILDEGQNTTVQQMKMFLTRMGNGSKIIVTGDLTQIDLPPGTRCGLADAVQRLQNIDKVGIVHLEKSDIVRHPLVQKIINAYEALPGG
jgi:phosphate starvation-inducible PhoH-like protein